MCLNLCVCVLGVCVCVVKKKMLQVPYVVPKTIQHNRWLYLVKLGYKEQKKSFMGYTGIENKGVTHGSMCVCVCVCVRVWCVCVCVCVCVMFVCVCGFVIASNWGRKCNTIRPGTF